MNKLLTILLLTLVVPCISFASEVQQTAMDKLIEGYQVKQRIVEPRDQKAEIIRLKSQLIDVRVERDQLSEQVIFLEAKIKDMSLNNNHSELHAKCLDVECIPITDVENDKIITHIIYSLSQYRLAELIAQTVPTEDVEAHKKAQRIMTGAKNDLDVLGFDTIDMKGYPSLDELMEQWIVSQGSRVAQ